MSPITYPTLRVTVLQGLRDLKEQFENDPSVLKADNCPYDPETIAVLTRILAPKIVTKTVEVQVEAPSEVGKARSGLLTDDESNLVDQTIGELLKQLNELGEGEMNLDTQTKIAIIKAKATLIDQMLKSHERVMNVKRIAEFQSIVIGILDDYVGEADRGAFLKRIEVYSGRG